MSTFATALALLMITGAPAKGPGPVPNCTGTGNWPASMVFVALKNAKLVTNDQIDFGKTQVSQIASERVNKDLWRQVLLVQYYRKDGTMLEAIAVSDASHDECSMSDVQTYIISEKLKPDGQKAK